MDKSIKLEFDKLLYQSGLVIFEAIPRPVYKDPTGNKYIYCYHRTKERKSEVIQLEEVLHADQILPQEISGEIAVNNKKHFCLRDSDGNFYRFRKFTSLEEWEKKCLS